jgi:hypothetical protein
MAIVAAYSSFEKSVCRQKNYLEQADKTFSIMKEK